jgi:L-asparaginase
MTNKILIISTGGTFNKIYNPINGELEIDIQSSALKNIASAWLCEFRIYNTIGKDSLDLTEEDRKLLVQTIKNSPLEKIIVIHGTDTMHITAKYLAKNIHDKKIILTGAMMPYSINPIEATANLASAYGYLFNLDNYGVFIAMNGIIGDYKAVSKNRTLGKFVLIEPILS